MKKLDLYWITTMALSCAYAIAFVLTGNRDLFVVLNVFAAASFIIGALEK
jgi:uncharacterized membrane protein